MVRKKKEPNRIDAMLDDLLADCQGPEDILGEAGLLKQLSQRLVERALAGELNHHLAHDEPPPDANSERRNSRNGYSKKTVQSTQGDLDLAIPRDRNGDFEPILVPKHQRRLSGLDEKILALYARGSSTRDISAQLEELYGAKVSASLISEVTDAVSEDVKAWQCRPLDEVYPMVYLDALYVNIKVSGRVSKRAVYVVLGVTMEGNKTLLGLWIGEADAEGAKFWLKVLTEIVYTQMTKPGLFPFKTGGNDVANLHLFMGNHHPVNQQFNQLPLLLKGCLFQSLLDPMTKCLGTLSQLRYFYVLMRLCRQLSLLSC
jgi:putative transposase